MQLRSRCRDQDPEKDRPLTPHFVVSVAQSPDVAKVRSLTEICGLRVQVEANVAQKGRFNANAASASGTRSVTAATHPGAWHSETCTRQGCVRPQSSSLNAASSGATILPNIAVAVSARRKGRPMKSARKGSAATRMASLHACRHPNRPQVDFRPNTRNWTQAGTTWLEAAAS
jgi:hypothetical protein